MRPNKKIKHMKNLLNSTMAFAVLAFAITSCKKGDITSKRLDGTWKLTSGSLTQVETSSGGSSSTTTTNKVYDGANEKVTVTIVPTPTFGNPAVKTNPYTEEYTFDRGEDSFTAKVLSTSVSTYQNTYYTTPTCDWNSGALYTVTETETTNSTATGNFTIMGSTGDIEKNSRMVLEHTKHEDVVTTKWTYKSSTGADVTTQLYKDDFNNGCSAAEATKTENETKTFSAGYMSQVWTVKSMSSSEMVVDLSGSVTRTGTNAASTTLTGEITYKQD